LAYLSATAIRHKESPKIGSFYFGGNMKEIQLTQGVVAIVDDEDYERISQRKWFCSRGYAVRMAGKFPHQSMIRMHREILAIQDKAILLDHINGNRSDNRKNNLRMCNNSQNLQNSKMRINNTSGYKGVYHQKKYDRWVTSICVGGKHMHIGSFDNPQEAARAYNEAAIKYHGCFAKLNEVGL
jgi:hypothetical protein